MSHGLTPEQELKALDDFAPPKEVVKQHNVPLLVEEIASVGKTFVDADVAKAIAPSGTVLDTEAVHVPAEQIHHVTSGEMPESNPDEDGRRELVSETDVLPIEPEAKKPTLAEMFPVKIWLETLPKGHIRTTKLSRDHLIPEPERSHFLTRRATVIYRGFEYWLDQFCGPLVAKRLKDFAASKQNKTSLKTTHVPAHRDVGIQCLA
jgi:hypothetical protein